MASVIKMALVTICLKTGLLPRWLAFVSYLTAVALLIAIDQRLWRTMTFPIFLLPISVLLFFRA